MAFEDQWLEEAAGLIGTTLSRLSNEDAVDVWTLVERKFAASGTTPLWQRMAKPMSLHDPHAWERLGTFVGENEVLMFFDLSESPTVFQISDGETLSQLLAECPQFVFYLTDSACSYVVALNDHDYLIACGDNIAGLFDSP